jgi:hypothetical protein|tara:strand:- start:5708 stop:6655 length:948 start_codon:yes stop_codon:yes gene_type:complete
MPDISKLSGVSESNIKNVDSVLKSNISNISGQGFSSVTYFLDTYSGASLAFSFRQLSGSATNCIDVINSNGITQTIGFSSGYVDTSAISSHCGTGIGRISKWYDQSGNNRHASQTSTSQMPMIFQSGNMLNVNGKAAASFDGGDRLVIASNTVHTGSFYGTSVIKTSSSISNASILNQDDSYNVPATNRVRIAQYLRTGSANGGTARIVVFNTSQSNFADNTAAISTNTQMQISSYATSSGTIEALVNSSSNGSSSYTGTLKTGAHEIAICSNVHGVAPGAYFTGNMQEVILWNGDQSSNRSSIESDIDTYYSIP